MDKKILSEKKYKAGYVVREERVKQDGSPAVTLKSAYNLHGDYIGNSKTAYRLCNKLGIKPELIKKSSGCCSIGFSEKDGKWYGWSHRAIAGFKVGHRIGKKVSGFDKLKKSFKIKTLNEAKQVAIRFADSVS